MFQKTFATLVPHPALEERCEHCQSLRRLRVWIGPGQKLIVCSECAEVLNEACGILAEAIEENDAQVAA